jgi:hypothetical protein
VDEVDPVEQEPPAPLPPRLALERMWIPDPGAPPAIFDPVDEHREPPPPWPVAHKRGLLTTVLVGLVTAIMLVILVTNGREIFSSRTHAARTIAAIKWVQYTDPATGFRIDYPSDWRVTREGVYTNFTHPQSAAALRIVAQPSSAVSAHAGWIELEKEFAKNQPSYRRIRLESKAYRSLDAAEWEFGYSRSGVALHNIDLGVVTGQQAYSLNFETQEANWTAVRPLFQRFESSFHPPTP